MQRILKEHVNVVGDSLEACLYSRYVAENNKEIKKIDHYVTDNLAGIYHDTVKESHYNILFLNGKTKNKILEILPNIKFEIITDNYIKIPTKKIKFSNN